MNLNIAITIARAGRKVLYVVPTKEREREALAELAFKPCDGRLSVYCPDPERPWTEHMEVLVVEEDDSIPSLCQPIRELRSLVRDEGFGQGLMYFPAPAKRS